jgi:hypothetical protein
MNKTQFLILKAVVGLHIATIIGDYRSRAGFGRLTPEVS